MSFLKALDRGFYSAVTVICGIAMIAILVIVNVQVFARFLFSFSIGGLADMPPFLMIYSIWLGAIMASRNDDHINIQIVDMITKNKKIIHVIDGILYLVTAIALLFFVKTSFDYTVHAFTHNSVHMGTGINMGIFYMVMPFSSLFMAVYYFINCGKKFAAIPKVGKEGNE